MYNSSTMDIQELTHAMHQFVTEKGWYDLDSPRPQTPKNLALSLSIEAAEVLELFQWIEKSPDPLASVSDIDLETAVLAKLEMNYTRSWDEKDQHHEENETHEC